MQRVYRDPSTSRGLRMQIYLRYIKFLLPLKLLYPFYPSILGSSFGSLPLRSCLPICSTATRGPKLWHTQASRSLWTLLFSLFSYINSPKLLNFLFLFLFFYTFFSSPSPSSSSTSGKRKDVQSSSCVSKCGYTTDCLTLTQNIPKATTNRQI